MGVKSGTLTSALCEIIYSGDIANATLFLSRGDERSWAPVEVSFIRLENEVVFMALTCGTELKFEILDADRFERIGKTIDTNGIMSEIGISHLAAIGFMLQRVALSRKTISGEENERLLTCIEREIEYHRNVLSHSK
jgi:hypothetical protein